MFRSLLLALILFSTSLARGDSPENLRFELRYGAFPSRTNQIDETLLYAKPITPWLNGEVGVRLAEVAWNFQALEYKGELEVPIVSFASVSLRLEHSWFPPNGASSTHLLLRGNLHVEPFEWLSLFGSFGWYERFIGLNGFTVLPRFWRDTADHDFAVLAGSEVRVGEAWSVVGTIGTFETINTFNINNPYVSAGVKYGGEHDIGELSLFARYRILLGFGRLDEVMVGVGLKFQLDHPGNSPLGAAGM